MPGVDLKTRSGLENSVKFKANKVSIALALKCPTHGKINNRGSGVPTILLPLPNVVCFTSTVNNNDM